MNTTLDDILSGFDLAFSITVEGMSISGSRIHERRIPL